MTTLEPGQPAVEVVGEGEIPYVFVQGSPGDHNDIWAALVAYAPPQARCILVDLPDHGDASDVDSPDTSVHREALSAVTEAAGPGATLVGHSFGAWLVAHELARAPSTVARGVLFGGFASLTEEVAQMRGQLADRLERGELTREALEDMAVQLLLGERHRGPEAEAAVRRTARVPSTARFVRWLRRNARLHEPSMRVGEFTVPARVVHGRDEPAIPFSLGEDLARQGTHAELVPFDTDSHTLSLTHPREAAELVFGEAFPAATAYTR